MTPSPSLIAAAAGVAFAVLGSACGGSPVGAMRFHNQPAVWAVNDRRPVRAQPEEPERSRMLERFDYTFLRQITRAMELPSSQRAHNVNALGEVPDSTWFTNRVGHGDLTPADVARGPNQQTQMAPGPLVIQSEKKGGTALGYLVQDRDGVKWLLKFDEDLPVIETATDVVVQRLLWALGYNVPENHIEYIARDRLVVGDDAEHHPKYGDARPLTDEDVDRALARVKPSGRTNIRVLASKLLPGEPLGGFAQTGTRADDPNDTVPHQHRREVRGLYVVFSWLKHTDVKIDNTLDMWVEDADRPGAHFVMHYLVDFGKALGAGSVIWSHPADGHVYNVDFPTFFASLATFGMWRRPWEGQPIPEVPGVGMLDAATFDPGAFRTHMPYAPFYEVDRYDALWATRLVLALERAHIRAAVQQGAFPDARALDRITDALVRRQRKLGRYWLTRVNPLVDFALRDDGRLCFTDLLVQHRLAPELAGDTRYIAEAFDYDGNRVLGARALPASDTGRVCFAGIRYPQARDGYTIVKLQTRNARDEAYGPVEVHLGRDPQTRRVHVIGVNRR